ncbi:MAG: hypothetical protein M1828_005202 [Chrysothrix sp. TS-e1954]|nr:MAG: hypothetical protein M1828_005202 [Chrysothrix sp. TS-e1954]
MLSRWYGLSFIFCCVFQTVIAQIESPRLNLTSGSFANLTQPLDSPLGSNSFTTFQNLNLPPNGTVVQPADVPLTNSTGDFGDISADVEVLIRPDGGVPKPLIVPATVIASLNGSSNATSLDYIGAQSLADAPSNPDLTSRSQRSYKQSRRRSHPRALQPRRNFHEPFAGQRVAFRLAATSASWLVVTFGNVLTGRPAEGVNAHQQLYNIIAGISQHLHAVVAYENFGPAGFDANNLMAQAVYGRHTTSYMVHNNVGDSWYFQAIGDDSSLFWDEIQTVWDTLVAVTYYSMPEARDCLISAWQLYEGNPELDGLQLAHGSFAAGNPFMPVK